MYQSINGLAKPYGKVTAQVPTRHLRTRCGVGGAQGRALFGNQNRPTDVHQREQSPR